MARRRQPWLKLFETFVRDIRIKSKEIVSSDPRGAPLVLWDSQRRFLREVGEGLDSGVHTFNCLKSRQLGVTTISLAIDVFWLAMHDNLIGCLVTDTEKNRDANRDLITAYVNSFPENYFGESFRITVSNRKQLAFSNGCRLDLLVAGTKKKSTAWGEGVGYGFAHMTETASYADAEGLKSLEEGFAQTNPNRLFIYESTAKGFNHWRTRWMQGLADRDTQRSFFIGWWASDVNRIERSDSRYAKFSYPVVGEERELIKLVQQLYDHKITAEQLAWFRWKQFSAGQEQELLDQNQPWCVTAGTRVGTARGILKIEDVTDVDVTNRGTVQHAGPTGEAEIWRARTKMGYELEGTYNHPLIDLQGEEVQLGDSVGTVVQLSAPKFADDIYTETWREGVVEHRVEITPDFARLLGLYMGDGSLSGRNSRTGWQFSICCASHDQDIIDESHRLIRTLFGVNTQQNSYREIGDGGWTAVKTSSRLVAETFVKLKLADYFDGRIRRVVHVPELIWRSPKHVVREFLRGLFEADGHSAKGKDWVVFASKHKRFVQDVQILLLGFGITCRSLPALGKIRKNNNGKVYSSQRMELRAEEAVLFHKEIGFLSKRKQTCSARQTAFKNPKLSVLRRQPVLMQDEIVCVESTERREPVYNLTVEAPHWFDANGILTHNTHDQAFVQTGYSFFQVRTIVQDWKRIDEDPNLVFYGYRYNIDGDFYSFSMQQMFPHQDDMSMVQLKVWEEPVPEGRYVIGFDPAYGRNDHKDCHAAEVFRCFADKIVQVAEFVANDMETKHASWVLFHLCGAYGDVMANVELGGPGRLVMAEFDHLRQLLGAEMNQQRTRERGWEDANQQARWFLYKKVDSPGPGYVANFETTWRTKMELMHSMRGAYVSREIVIRSKRLLEEMKNVVVVDDKIGAPESTDEHKKDDRVFGTALANRAWQEWIRKEMLAMGQTYEVVMQRESDEATPVQRSVNSIVYRFLAGANVEPEPERGPKWMTDRGLL